jgi:hypothetical protein
MTQHVHSVPVMRTNREGWVERLNTFLDRYVLPFPVKYLTNRVVILLTLCLLVPLVAFAHVTVFVLAANSYLNVMSVVVSSTVLLYSTLSEARDRAAAERREQIAAEHQKVLDARAEEDHRRIEQIYQNLIDLNDQTVAKINTSLENIQTILLDHLEVNQAEDHAHVEEMHRAVVAGLGAHRQELDSLRRLLEAVERKS